MNELLIPQGYQRVMPYLIIKNAEAFLAFMQKVFLAQEKMKIMRDDALIMHAELMIGSSTIMFADATAEFPAQPAGMFVYVENTDETYQKALAEGASSTQEPSNQDYGRAAGVIDPFGNTWWITQAI
jgi:PhnB protein